MLPTHVPKSTSYRQKLQPIDNNLRNKSKDSPLFKIKNDQTYEHYNEETTLFFQLTISMSHFARDMSIKQELGIRVHSRREKMSGFRSAYTFNGYG